ncbi:MAG: DUF1697 domain-containing protein [Thermoanaerobaculia bacterium]
MQRYVAFLRGMNLGGRRITNVELCACFVELRFASPSAFLASGNVVFDSSRGTPEQVAAKIENGLAEVLGYEVPTFLRSAEEVRAIAAHEAFPAEVVACSRGKLQVALLPAEPSSAARRRVLDLATEEDRLTFHGRELYWLPSGGISESPLDVATIEATVGPWTMRTRRTVERLAAKFLAA